MSDFLQSLIERNLEEPAVMRPRTAARFEPAPLAGGMADALSGPFPAQPAETWGEESLDGASERYQEDSERTPAGGRAAASDGDPSAKPASSGQGGRTHRRRQAAGRLVQPVGGPPWAEAQGGVPRQTRTGRPSPAQDQDHPAPAAASTRWRPADAQPGPERSSGAPPLRRQGESLPGDSRSRGEVELSVRPGRGPQPEEPEEGGALRQPPLPARALAASEQPPPRPRPEGRTSAGRPSSKESPRGSRRPAAQPPLGRPRGPSLEALGKIGLPTVDKPVPLAPDTIQVTIGRVEVRAVVAPSAQPRKPRPQPPVMSLDEYLKRQTGGGRQ
ncbi:MAG TPA: hypothetical protein VLV83_07585 [Acidobacteriota bacterium]|nr:hypothetical protein [Acidobacteriota bacterium]